MTDQVLNAYLDYLDKLAAELDGCKHIVNYAFVVHLPECPASRDDDQPEHEITCTCGGRDE